MIATIFLTVVALILVALYFKIKDSQSYWSKKGVKRKPTTFLFGDIAPFIFRKKPFNEVLEDIYNSSPETRYSCFYSFVLPAFMTKDPELLKQLTVKDFDSFTDHKPFLPTEADPIFSQNLFSLRGKQWRDMRTTLSPAFTSSKMKQLFQLINELGQKFPQYFLDNPQEAELVELKDIFSRFATDVIASTAFGLKCDSLTEKTNEFYTAGKELTTFDRLSKILKFFSYLILPKLSTALGLEVFPLRISKFFQDIINSTIEQREENGVKRPDMLNILMEAKKGKLHFEESDVLDTGFATVSETQSKTYKDKVPITNDVIAGQAMIFFFAGFETVATCMTFTAYELVANPEIQQKLQQEIDATIVASNGDLTYELLLKMKYLDMVISESLRKWPPLMAIDRICTKRYKLDPSMPGEIPLELEEEEVMLWLPIYCIHRDPQFYPDPDRFDPERFNEENRSKIVPSTYIPFGAGPRACIGSRFALLEVKTMLFHLLSNFNLVPTPQTVVPLKVSKKNFTMQADGGIWLRLEPRPDVR